jgi:hypothetical protein
MKILFQCGFGNNTPGIGKSETGSAFHFMPSLRVCL